MLFWFKPIILLDWLCQSVTEDIKKRLVTQHQDRLNVGRNPEFEVNQKVYVRFWHGSKRYMSGVIVTRACPLSYDVQDEIRFIADTRLCCFANVSTLATLLNVKLSKLKTTMTQLFFQSMHLVLTPVLANSPLSGFNAPNADVDKPIHAVNEWQAELLHPSKPAVNAKLEAFLAMPPDPPRANPLEKRKRKVAAAPPPPQNRLRQEHNAPKRFD